MWASVILFSFNSVNPTLSTEKAGLVMDWDWKKVMLQPVLLAVFFSVEGFERASMNSGRTV